MRLPFALPFAGKFKLVYERTLQNPHTRFYLALALFHCLLQLALQSTAYVFDNRASSLVTFIVEDSGVTRGVTIVSKTSSETLDANGNGNGTMTVQSLNVCDGVPGDGPRGDVCSVVASKVTASPVQGNVGKRNLHRGGSGGGSGSGSGGNGGNNDNANNSNGQGDDGDDNGDDNGSDDGDDNSGSDNDSDDDSGSSNLDAFLHSATNNQRHRRTIYRRSYNSNSNPITIHRRAIDISLPSISKGSISLTRAFANDSSSSSSSDNNNNAGASGTPVVVTSVLLSQDFFAGNNAVNMSANCVRAMQWPNEILRNARREDITTIVFQVWLFGISFVAVVNESIPHLLAALLSHFLATAWSGYLLHRTLYFRGTFGSLLTSDACVVPGGAFFVNAISTSGNATITNEIDILDSYWDRKVGVVIPIIVFNVVVLPFAGYITWKLYKAFSNQSVERVGTDERVTMMYKFVFLFWGLQQLAAFFLIASSGLWVNEVSTGIILEIAENQVVRRLIEGVFIAIMVLELPWSLLGYKAIRLESKPLTIIFFSIGFLFVAARASLFASPLYRWSFVAWPFFAAMCVAALALEVLVLASGLVCVRNFGRGVRQFLDVQSALEASDFTPGNFPVHVDVDPDADSKAPRFSTIFPAKGKLTATYMPKVPISRRPVPQFSSTTTLVNETTGVTVLPLDDLEKQQQNQQQQQGGGRDGNGVIGRWIVNPASLNADIGGGGGGEQGDDSDEKIKFNEDEFLDVSLKSPPQVASTTTTTAAAAPSPIIRIPLPLPLPVSTPTTSTATKKLTSTANGLAKTMSRMSIRTGQRLRISLSSSSPVAANANSGSGFPSPGLNSARSVRSVRSPRSPFARSAVSQRGNGNGNGGSAESPVSGSGITVIPGPLARSTSHSTFGPSRRAANSNVNSNSSGNSRFSYASEVVVPASPYGLQPESPQTQTQTQTHTQNPPGLGLGIRTSINTFGEERGVEPIESSTSTSSSLSSSVQTPTQTPTQTQTQPRTYSHSSTSSSIQTHRDRDTIPIPPPTGLQLNLPGSRFSFLSTITSSSSAGSGSGSSAINASTNANTGYGGGYGGYGGSAPPSSYRGF